MNLWHSIGQVCPGLFHISDKGRASIWLLVGSRQALLIDTGWGIPCLKEVVSGLTSLPEIVANSHGHPDPCKGDYLADQVHIHPDGPINLGAVIVQVIHMPGHTKVSVSFLFPNGAV